MREVDLNTVFQTLSNRIQRTIRVTVVVILCVCVCMFQGTMERRSVFTFNVFWLVRITWNFFCTCLMHISAPSDTPRPMKHCCIWKHSLLTGFAAHFIIYAVCTKSPWQLQTCTILFLSFVKVNVSSDNFAVYCFDSSFTTNLINMTGGHLQ